MSTLPPSQFLANHIRDAYRHTEVLSQTIKTVPEQQSQFLMDCLEELHVCLEEMEVAQEELCQQHEEVCLAQQQIEIERQRYRSLFEFAPDGYLVTDRWGTIREANQAATNLFKIRRDRIIGKPLATWVSEEYRRAFRTILNELPQLKRVQEWEIKLCDRELGVFDVAITVAFDRCVGTAGGSFRWLIRDISQRKQAENQLQQTQLENLQLLETDRLRRQFMATLTHELRTPMNAILGFSDLLLRKWNHQGCLQEINLLERVQRNGRHLLHLIEDMLDFSKLEANRMPLHLQEIDLGQVIALVVEELRPLAAKKQLELRSQIQPEPLTVMSDPLRLRQIVINLLSNAIKFTDVGSVVVDVFNLPEGRIAIVVRDTGLGISPADQTRIFQEFWQVNQSTTRSQGGTGLGLAITKALVERMQGTISVESEVGIGSTFRVELPRQVSGV
jgi:PAS domain S-box-containing protein